MELKNFIKDVIVEVFEGVKEAQSTIKEDGSVINPYDWYNPNFQKEDAFAVSEKTHIEFEVAITVSDSTESKDRIEVIDDVNYPPTQSDGVGFKPKNECT